MSSVLMAGRDEDVIAVVPLLATARPPAGAFRDMLMRLGWGVLDGYGLDGNGAGFGRFARR
jgi:hypothetical protein